jgi:hypothetical protein
MYRLGVALGLALLPLAGARAQNLVTNPAFDHDLEGWTVEQGAAVWSPQDAAASLFSGSLAALPTAPGQGAIIGSNCFAASPGRYSLAYKHSETGPDQFGVTAFLRWYSDASCNAWFASSTSLGGSSYHPAWQTLSSANLGFDLIAPAGTRSAALEVYADSPAYFDDFVVVRQSTCASLVCLNDGRFAVDVRWYTAEASGHGTPVDVTADSATYSLFGTGNVELVVKVLDGCAVNGHHWVFMAGLTDVMVLVTVTEVATATAWSYSNPLGQPFPPIQDISAFASCP